MGRNYRLKGDVELAQLTRSMRMRQDEAKAKARIVPTGGSAVIVLPWPPTGNSAVRHTAAGGHYLRPEVRRYRAQVASICAGMPRIDTRYRLNVHFSPPDARRRDMDNALKSLLDALVRAGWLPDDSMTYMRELHTTTDDARNGCVIVSATGV